MPAPSTGTGGPHATEPLICLAMVAFLIQSVGFFLLPGDEWLRAAGQVGFALVFFSYGYEKDFAVSRATLLAALALFINAGLTGQSLLPLNLLAALAFWQATLFLVSRKSWVEDEPGVVWVVLLTLYLPAVYMFEYGTMAAMFLCLGYLTAQARGTDKLPFALRVAWLFTVFFTACMLAVSLNLSLTPAAILLAAFMILAIGLMQYETRAVDTFTSRHIGGGESTIATVAAHWVWIYAAQAMLFQWYGFASDPERFNKGFSAFF